MTSIASVVLQLYAKYPEPGNVKTRLGSHIGENLATALYAGMLHSQLQEAFIAADKVAAAGRKFRVELWGDTDPTRPCYQVCLQRYSTLRFARQCDGSLGDRLAFGLQAGFTVATHVLMIGADCPAMRSRHILDARQALLDGAEVVLIPAIDGGYVLIGFSRPVKSAFKDIHWGSDIVLEQTLQALRGRTVSVLEPLADIDTVGDLRCYRSSLYAGQ